jgi:dTDP-4-amino-4,6-dideoxygalactose transaminase
MRIKRKYKLFMVEDCSHCFGAKSNNQACGTFGDASIFSLHYTKPLHCLYGGFAMINNPLLFEYFEQYKNIPKAPLLKELQILTKNDIQSVLLSKYVFSFFTWYLLLLIYKLARIDLLDVFSKDDKNYICRLPQKIGRLNLNILDKNLDKIATRNLEMVQLFKEFKLATRYSTQIIPLLYPLHVDDKQQAYTYFKNRCIDVKRVYSVNIIPGKNKNAQLLEDHIIYIPFYPALSRKDRDYIISLLSNRQ